MIGISTNKKTLNLLYSYKQPIEDTYRGGNKKAYRGNNRKAYRDGNRKAYIGGLLSRFKLVLTKRD